MLSDTLQLVRIINCYDGMTIRQVMRRFRLAEGSYTDCSKRLAQLAQPVKSGRRPSGSILEQKVIPHPTKIRGGASAVYVVGSLGRALLQEHGDEVKRQKFERGTGISDHNWHSFWVNDIFITAHLWADQTPGIRIRGKMTDFDMKRDKRFPYPVTWEDDTAHKTEMDGLLGIKRAEHIGKDKQYLLELETGSNEPAAIRRKVQSLVMFVDHFKQVFGTNLFNGFLFFATATYGLKQGNPRYDCPDDQRKILLREIAKTLTEIGHEHYAPLFRVTASPLDSTNLFTDPVWYFPAVGPCNYDAYRLFVDVR
jgi:hypothetical protein